MTTYELMTLLRYCDPHAPVTVLCDGEELPLRSGAAIVTQEGSGAALVFYAINVERSK